MLILSLAALSLPAVADEPKAAVTSAVIAETVKNDIGKFADCYDANTKDAKKKPAGKVLTRFTIGADGKVTKAEIVSSELKSEKLEGCVADALKTLSFPAPAGGATQVEYPFQFAPKALTGKKKPRK